LIAKAYRVADAIRAAGVPVVMGGPHVTGVPEEALGRAGDHAVAMPWASAGLGVSLSPLAVTSV